VPGSRNSQVRANFRATCGICGRRRCLAGPTTLRRYDGHMRSSTYLSRLFPSARCYLDDIAAGLKAAYGSAAPAAGPGLAAGGVDG